MRYIIERLTERSTWVGLTTAASAIGVAIEPELTERIIQAGVAVMGVVFLVTKDKDLPVIVKREESNEPKPRREKSDALPDKSAAEAEGAVSREPSQPPS